MNNNPYVGPRSIGGVDHQGEKVYGRSREIADLMDLLIADRIVLVYSPSGAGKSSLLQAGLAPAMEKRRFHVRPMVRVNAEPPPEVNFDPANGNRYALSALLSLEEGLPKEKKTPSVDLARMTLVDYLGEEPNGEVLIFDQFEEVLTVDPLDRPEKEEFFTQLGDALRSRGRWAVFAMREDYLAGLDPYVNFVPTRFSNTFRLGLLEKAAALESVCMPAEAAGVEFAQDAAKALVENLSSIRVQNESGKESETPGLYVEPVQLQVVCRRIWSKLDDGTRTIGIGAVGGVSTVDEALGGYYEDTVRDAAGKSGVSERAIRDWFGRSLITRQKTRSQVSKTDDATAPVQAALKPLVDAYLIRSDRRLAAIWYELAHDRLIGPVLTNNAKNISELQRRAELWERQGRSEGLLLAGKDLSKLKAWKQAAATNLEREFLDKSRYHRNAQWVVRGLGALAAVCMLVAIWGLWQNHLAQQENRRVRAQIDKDRGTLEKEKADHKLADQARDTAATERDQSRQGESTAKGQLEGQTHRRTSSSLATIAGTRRGGSVDLAALLSVEAWNQAQTAEARFGMFDILRSNPRVKVMLHHDAQVHTAVFGPDGKLATGCSDGTIWIWDVARRTHTKIATHGGPVLSVAFNQAGLLASGSADGQVRLWDPKTGQALPGPSQAHKGRVNVVAFDPGSRVLLSGGQDGVIRFWTVQNRGLAPASAQDGVPASLAANLEVKSAGIRLADRQVVAVRGGVVAGSSSALLWNLDSPTRPTTIVSDNAEAAGISESGRRFVVKGNDSVLVWEGGSQPKRYANLETFGWRWAAALSPVRNLIAVGGDGRKVHVYDLGASQPWLELQGPENIISTVAFSRDATMLASLSENDRSVWIWDISYRQAPVMALPATDAQLAGNEPLQHMVMDPGGRWFATSFGSDSLATYTRLPSGKWGQRASKRLSGHFYDTWRPDWRPLLAASSRADRPFLVVGEPTGRISMRDPLTLNEIGVIPAAHGQIAGLALNFDGTVLAVSGWREDTSLRIYSLRDLAHPVLLHTQFGPVSPLEAFAFSPTRNLLAAGGNTMMGDLVQPENSEIRLWDLQEPSKPRLAATIPHLGAHRLLFSPDGKTLVTAGTIISLWDVPEGPPTDRPKELFPRAVLGSTVGWPRQVRFSPDGGLLATAESVPTSSGPGMRIHLWDTVRGVRFGDPVEFPWPVDVGVFEADGKGLLLWSTEGIKRLPLDPAAWVRDLCARANRNLTAREWELYVGGDYGKTCPNLPDGEGAVSKPQ